MKLFRETGVVLILAVLALSTPGCATTRSPFREQNQFGIESAQKGLWREAIFRWKRSLKINPYSPILHNNLAVAYESLGRFDQAAEAYERALELGKNRYEAIRENYEQFMAFYSIYQGDPEDDSEGS